MIPLLFWTLTLLGCGYAAAAGGKEGRWAAILILCAALLSAPATLLGRHWLGTELSLFAVDGALLAGLHAISLRGRRWFPVWMTGFQLVSTTTHLSTIIAPDFTPRIYQAMEQLWAVPMTLAMVIGIALDARVDWEPTQH